MTWVNSLKKVRTLNLLNTLQFCRNPLQPLLIHDLIADAVEFLEAFDSCYKFSTD